MKLFSLILLFISTLMSCHQSKIDALAAELLDKKEQINELEEKLDAINKSDAQKFRLAILLEKTNSLKAEELLTQLAKGDSINIFQKLAIQRLAFNNGELEKSSLIQKIIGKWHWEWSGTNWGTATTPDKCGCTKTMILKDNMTFKYYENRKLVRSGNFELKRKYKYFSGGPSQRLIKFSDDNSIHSIQFSQKSTKVIVLGEPTPCLCGCYEERFVRKKSRLIVSQ